MTFAFFVRRAALSALLAIPLIFTPCAARAGEPGDSWFAVRPWDISVSGNYLTHRGQSKFGGRLDGNSYWKDAPGVKAEVRYGRGHLFRYGFALAFDRSQVSASLPQWFGVSGNPQRKVTLGEVTRITPAFEWEIHPFRDERLDFFAGPGLEYSLYSFSANPAGAAAGITDPKITGGLRLTLRSGLQYILGPHWALRTELRWAKAEAKFDVTVNPPLIAAAYRTSSPIRHSAVTASLGATYRF